MKQIRLGLENNVNISIYAKPEINWRIMEQLRLSLISGIDVSIYGKINSDFKLNWVFKKI